MSVTTLNREIHDLRVRLGCSQEIMGRIIGVTGRTIARWEEGENEPHPLARQQILQLHNLLDKMEGVIKEGMQEQWLNTPNESLGDKTPLEVIAQGPLGIQEIVHLLGRIEWGIAT